MDSGPAAHAPSPSRLRTLGWGLSAAVLFLAVWIPLHPARPPQPTADVTTHLSVARHLVRGEGYLTDVAYPLSFAFDFARELPQPLIHRQPGFATLLTLPVATAGLDPVKSLSHVRLLQIVLLGLTIFFGAAALYRRGAVAAILPWMLLMGANPLLAFAVDWVFVELLCGLVILALWLRAEEEPGPLDGILAGILSLLRLDLFWLPIFWWILARPRGASRWRRTALAILVMAAVMTPWALRTQSLTGRPFFSLQGYAELVKDTREWPGYTVYRQLEPQPLGQTLVEDPVPVLRKAGRGVKFFLKDVRNFAPLPLVLIFAVGILLIPTRLRAADGPGFGRAGPRGVAGLTLALLIVQYSFFDHSLRHLLVLLPVLAWEAARFLARSLPANRMVGASVVTLAMILLFPCRLPGWESAARDAVTARAETEARIERFRDRRDPVLFVPDGTIPWRLDRPGVWNPGDEDVRNEIRDLLGVSEPSP